MEERNKMKVIQKFLHEGIGSELLSRYMSKKDSELPNTKQIDHVNVDVDGVSVPKPIAKLGKNSSEAWIEKKELKDKMTRQAN